MKQYHIILTALLFSACNNVVENPFCDNTTIIKSSDKFTELEANLLVSGDTLPHINDLIIVDNLLFADTSDENARIRIFSIEGEEIGIFGKSGRAQNEFTSGMSFIRQTSQDKLFLKDVNKGAISIWNIDSLLTDASGLSPRVIRSFPRVLNAFISDDSNLIYEHEVPGSYALSSQNITTDSILWDERLYSPTDDAFSKYHSYMTFCDKNHKIASAMRFRNQINFFDTNTRHRKSVIVNNHKNKLTEDDGHQYYCSISANENNIFALYMNQSSEDSYHVAKPMEIHVFDWNGNFNNIYRVNEYLIRIAVDKNGNIYGKDIENNIYKYAI